MRASSVRLGLAILTSAAAVAVSPARAETVNCTAVPTAPYTISTAGLWCLTDDLTVALVSGNAITITANNVVLDLNGYRVSNLAGAGTGAFGIYGSKRANVTVRNGTVRGFFIGVSFDDVSPYTNSQGNVVEDVHAYKNTYAGISALGRQSIIRRNHVESTGGSTLFGGHADSYAIQVYGPDVRVLDNDVTIVTKLGDGATAWGIYFGSSSDDGVAMNNRIASADTGLEMATASVKFRDNLTMVVTTPFVGGTNAGNNN